MDSMAPEQPLDAVKSTDITRGWAGVDGLVPREPAGPERVMTPVKGFRAANNPWGNVPSPSERTALQSITERPGAPPHRERMMTPHAEERQKRRQSLEALQNSGLGPGSFTGKLAAKRGTKPGFGSSVAKPAAQPSAKDKPRQAQRANKGPELEAESSRQAQRRLQSSGQRENSSYSSSMSVGDSSMSHLMNNPFLIERAISVSTQEPSMLSCQTRRMGPIERRKSAKKLAFDNGQADPAASAPSSSTPALAAKIHKMRYVLAAWPCCRFNVRVRGMEELS